MNANLFSVLTETEWNLPYYITTVGGWDHQDAMLREGGYPDFQWIQCLNGEGTLRTEGQEFRVGPGSGMLLYPHRMHHYYALKEPWEVRWIGFNGSHAQSMLESLGFTHSQALALSDPMAVLDKLEEGFQLLASKDPLRNVKGSALIYQIGLDLFTCGTLSDMRSKQEHYEQLQPVLVYIEDRFNQALTLADLASQLHVSPQYTCSLFQQTLGLRPFEYINRYRLRKAKELLLAEIRLDVKEVARRVGYEHPSYFIKLFKQQEGVTPNIFRKLHRISG